MAALFAGRIGPHDGVVNAARAVRAVPAFVYDEATGTGLLLDGYGLLFSEGAAAAAPVLRRALDVIRPRGDVDSLGAAYEAAFELWDDDALYAFAQRRTDVARATGPLVALPAALSQLGSFELLAGRFDVAKARFQEASEIMRGTGRTGILGSSQIGSFSLAVWRGGEVRARTLAEVCASDGVARGLGAFSGFAKYALSILDLGLCNYRRALDAAQDACLDVFLLTRVLPELAEAAVRCGEPAGASAAADKLAESTLASGTEWAPRDARAHAGAGRGRRRSGGALPRSGRPSQNLSKVFRKLGVTSRTELAAAMFGARLERHDS